MKVKPDLSFWKLWNISFGFFLGTFVAQPLNQYAEGSIDFQEFSKLKITLRDLYETRMILLFLWFLRHMMLILMQLVTQ